MKKIYYFILISAVIFICGCENDRYAAEKQFWQAQKLAEKIFSNPHVSPTRELEKTVNILKGFAARYPQSKLSVQADFTIAKLYLAKEEYDNARAHLNSLIDKYGKSGSFIAEAVFLIGNSYELQNQWETALKQYRKVMNDFPVTFRGVDIPMYIASYYKSKFQPERMIYALREAITHYKTLAEQYPDSLLSFHLNSLIAQCYVELKEWNNAANTLELTIDKYKGKFDVSASLMQMASIYDTWLNDRPKSKEILERIIREYPKTKLAQKAAVIIKEMDKNGR